MEARSHDTGFYMAQGGSPDCWNTSYAHRNRAEQPAVPAGRELAGSRSAACIDRVFRAAGRMGSLYPARRECSTYRFPNASAANESVRHVHPKAIVHPPRSGIIPIMQARPIYIGTFSNRHVHAGSLPGRCTRIHVTDDPQHYIMRDHDTSSSPCIQDEMMVWSAG